MQNTTTKTKAPAISAKTLYTIHPRLKQAHVDFMFSIKDAINHQPLEPAQDRLCFDLVQFTRGLIDFRFTRWPIAIQDARLTDYGRQFLQAAVDGDITNAVLVLTQTDREQAGAMRLLNDIGVLDEFSLLPPPHVGAEGDKPADAMQCRTQEERLALAGQCAGIELNQMDLILGNPGYGQE